MVRGQQWRSVRARLGASVQSDYRPAGIGVVGLAGVSPFALARMQSEGQGAPVSALNSSSPSRRRREAGLLPDRATFAATRRAVRLVVLHPGVRDVRCDQDVRNDQSGCPAEAAPGDDIEAGTAMWPRSIAEMSAEVSTSCPRPTFDQPAVGPRSSSSRAPMMPWSSVSAHRENDESRYRRAGGRAARGHRRHRRRVSRHPTA